MWQKLSAVTCTNVMKNDIRLAWLFVQSYVYHYCNAEDYWFQTVTGLEIYHLEQTMQVASLPSMYTEHGSVPHLTSTGKISAWSWSRRPTVTSGASSQQM